MLSSISEYVDTFDTIDNMGLFRIFAGDAEVFGMKIQSHFLSPAVRPHLWRLTMFLSQLDATWLMSLESGGKV